jgi:hypothetical protein
LILTDTGETASPNVHGDPSKSPSAFGSSNDGFKKSSEGADSSVVVVVVGASEVVASAVLVVVRVSAEDESSVADVVAVAGSVVIDEVGIWESDVAVAVEVRDSEMIEDRSVVEDSAIEVAVEISVEAESVASVVVPSIPVDDDFGLHGPACPLPQSASVMNVREKRVAFMVLKFVR